MPLHHIFRWECPWLMDSDGESDSDALPRRTADDLVIPIGDDGSDESLTEDEPAQVTQNTG